MWRLLPLPVLVIGLALLAPLALFVSFITNNYAVGFGIDLNDRRLVFGVFCTVLGIAAVVWSFAKLCGQKRR
jgi:hypothetical protein